MVSVKKLGATAFLASAAVYAGYSIAHNPVADAQNDVENACSVPNKAFQCVSAVKEGIPALIANSGALGDEKSAIQLACNAIQSKNLSGEKSHNIQAEFASKCLTAIHDIAPYAEVKYTANAMDLAMIKNSKRPEGPKV